MQTDPTLIGDPIKAAQVIQLHRAGHMDSEVARRVGVTAAEVARIIDLCHSAALDVHVSATVVASVAPKTDRNGATRGLRWTPEMLSCLGRMPDARVAERFGLCDWTVSRKRRALGIPRWRRPGFQWTPAVVVELFALRAKEFTRKHRVPWGAVKAKRDELHVPHKRRQNYNRVAFTSAMIGLLGKRPDSRLARGFKTSASSIAQKRRALGIPSFRSSLSPWTREYLGLLGRIPDTQLARRMGIGFSSVAKRRYRLGIRPCVVPFKWTKPRVALLGTMPDATLAERLSLSLRQVVRRRPRLGVASFEYPNTRWTPERAALLGAMSDAEAANLLGVTQAAVRIHRNRSRIQRHKTPQAAIP